jgi:hypothetical protein
MKYGLDRAMVIFGGVCGMRKMYTGQVVKFEEISNSYSLIFNCLIENRKVVPLDLAVYTHQPQS